MKITSFRQGGADSYGVIDGETLIDLAPIAKDVGATLKDALARQSLGRIAAWAATASRRIALGDVELLPVIPDPDKILCVGINYLAHVKETGREVPQHPMIFTRFADTLIGHGRWDRLIPFAMGEALAKKAGGPVTTLWIDRADHNDFFDVGGEQIDQAIVKFLAGLSRSDR